MSYPWVAYCAPYLSGMTQDKCGKLLRMTNNRTGARTVVRMVDMCGHSGERGGGELARRSREQQQHQRARPPSWCLPASSPSPCPRCKRMAGPHAPPPAPPPSAAIDADQQSAFIPLDTDRQGYFDGDLSVTLELVAC